MAVIITRAGKGSPLTNAELDANFNNINTQLSTAVITGGTIDGATIGATTATTGKFSQLDVDNLRLDANTIISTDTNGNITLTPNGTGTVAISKATIVEVTDNTNAALRITQLGTGNALLVEDDTNPDATPFVIDASGNVIKGRTSQVAFSGTTPGTLIANNVGAAANLGQLYYANNSSGPFLLLGKSRGSSGAPFTTVSSGDTLGTVQFEGADGTGLIVGASISTAVDGTPGTSDMPGRLVFSTTADGASSPTERMRIDSTGAVEIRGNNSGITSNPPNNILRFLDTDTTTTGTQPQGRIEWQVSDSSAGAPVTAYIESTSQTIEAGGNLIMATAPTGGTATERMRITAGGDVGIGTTSPTSGLQTAGSSSKSAFRTPNIAEVNTISATAATGTINYDVTTQSILYYTTNASGNFTVNFRGSSGTSLDTIMSTGESMSVTFLVTNGATAYYNSAVQVDGSSVTPKWQGGTAPTSGNASSIDSYTYVIIKTGSAAFTVLAAQTKFA